MFQKLFLNRFFKKFSKEETFDIFLSLTVGKWHLGWDKSNYGDQIHGPLGHGFDHFYGLPFTLVDGFQYNNIPFFTYSNLSKDVST